MEGQCFSWRHTGQPDTCLHFATKQPPAESSLALWACPGPPLTYLCLSFCCRSQSGNPYKDSPASNSGQARPGDLLPESLLTGAQRTKVT